jgi:23S rRNA pseudouridine1911/1915/1917 synthase
MPATLDKPAGLPVFPPHADSDGDCLLARLLREQPGRRDIDWPNGFDGGIAHRLDNATSGAVIVADSLEELTTLRGWFADHQLLKTYWLLTDRDAPWDQNVCDKPIAHDKRRKGRMIVQRGNDTPHRGKWYPATTEFRRLHGKVFEATMRTGVTHQIRAHGAFVGIPVVELHHVGVKGPDDFASDAVDPPTWFS